VYRDDFQEYVPVDGIVSPAESIYLDIALGGTIERKYVEDGAIVKSGDTIVKLFNAEQELEFANKETQMFEILNNLQASKAGLEKRSIEMQSEQMQLNYKLEVIGKKYETDKELRKAGVISEYEFIETKREYEYLQKQMEIANAAYKTDSVYILKQIRALNNSIGRMKGNMAIVNKIFNACYIIAPASGQISALEATVGELKKPGDKLGQVDMMGQYKIVVRMDERYISRVFNGQEAIVEYTGKTYPLTVSKILPEVKDGTFPLHLLFTGNVPEGIKRGQNLPVKIKFGNMKKALIVKRGAFYQSTGGNWIFVISNNKATKREIKIGRQNSDSYEVLEGLEAGEQVIVSSYKHFEDKDILQFN
jgi:HlyD family secretion protein